MRLYAKTLSRTGDAPLLVSKWAQRVSVNSLVQVFGRFCRWAGLRNASSDSGRCTFLTGLAHKGVNARVLASLTKHKNISNTQRYIEVGSINCEQQ